MATYTVSRATHQLLTGSTVDTVNLTSQWQQVLITNRTGTAEIYVTVDGSTPAVGADNTYVLVAAVGSRVIPLSPTSVALTGQPTIDNVIKLISSGAMQYSVEGIV